MFDPKLKSSLFFKLTSFVQLAVLSIFFVLPSGVARAQTFSVLSLPKPGTMITTSEKFVPPLLKGISLHKENPLVFDFIIDPGNAQLSSEEVQKEGQKLIKYFLASLTIPENDLWVNLSPYENNKIIPKEFGETEMGRDLLAQDYVLKQLSASLIYPEKDLGKDFWNRVYQKALAKYGTTDIPMSTFNKVWIIPEKAVILETEDTAYVVRSRLKVMMEQDYIALDQKRADEVLGTNRMQGDDVNQVSSISSDVVREIIIPEIEKEVNEGKNFSQLRQIFNSLVLANWFKDNLKSNIINQVYSDQTKILGVDVLDKSDKEKIYQQYLSAYRQGVFNYIKEDLDPTTGEAIPRKYFSGGVFWAKTRQATEVLSTRTGSNRVSDFLGRGDVEPGELAGTDSQKLQRIVVGLQGVRGAGGDIQRANRDNSMLSRAWSNRRVAKKISEMFNASQVNNLDRLFTELRTATGDQKVLVEKQIKAILSSVNAQRLLQIEGDQVAYQTFQAAKPNFVEDIVDDTSRETTVRSFEEGEVAIEAIAGGAASRMKDGLENLQIDGLEEKDYRIWNINVWDIIRKIKASNPQIADKKLKKVLEILKSIEIPEYAKYYTAGQRTMMAIAEGINNLTSDEARRERIRSKLKIVLHINEDIRESVVQDLRNNNFFGFQPSNIILVNGGYGDGFVVSNGKVKVTPKESKTTWNHGFALTELDWYKGFTVDAQGNQIETGGSVFDELEKGGVKYALARRINDGILLHPQGAMDLDFVAAAQKVQRENPQTNLVYEAMKNPTAQKGGLALTSEQMGAFSFLLEGVNAEDKGIQQHLSDLTVKAVRDSEVPTTIKSRIDQLIAESQTEIDIPAEFTSYLQQLKNRAGQDDSKMGDVIDQLKKIKENISLNALSEEIQGLFRELDELAQKSGGIPYNRFYFVYDVSAIRKAITENGGLPMTLKYKNGEITPEIPAGDVTQIKGVNSVVLQRKFDFLFESGLIPSEDAYSSGKGALIHDFKEPGNLPMVAKLADFLDRNYTIPQERRDASMLTESQRAFEVVRQSEFLPAELRGVDLEKFKSELRNPTSLGSGRLLLAREETDRVSRSIQELRGTDDVSVQGNVRQALEKELSFWKSVVSLLDAFVAGSDESRESETTRGAQNRAEAFGQEIQARLEQQAGLTERPVVDVANSDLKGGIDLNPANLKIELNKENGGINVEFDPKLLEELRQQGIEGFIPVIINVQPMDSVLPLLTQNADASQLQTANI